jgi:archaellum component FlaD/FlaE
MADSNWFTRLMSGPDGEETAGAEMSTEELDDGELDGQPPELGMADADDANEGDQSPADQRVVELEHRIDQLEDRLDDQDATLETVRHSQDDVADRVDDLNDTVREVLGIYDRLVAESNPFVTDENGDDEAFGLLDDDGSASTSAAAGHAGDHPSPGHADPAEASQNPPSESNGQSEDVVGFEDLVDETNASENPDGTHDGEHTHAHEDEHASHVESANTPTGVSAPDTAGPGPYLTSIDGSYAVDTIVFEWFGELIETAGPSETLRAIGYYEDIGWIDSEVAGTLETYLGGPSLDIHVDPSTPTELTAEDHAQSYQYIRKLAAVQTLTEDTR